MIIQVILDRRFPGYTSRQLNLTDEFQRILVSYGYHRLVEMYERREINFNIDEDLCIRYFLWKDDNRPRRREHREDDPYRNERINDSLINIINRLGRQYRDNNDVRKLTSLINTIDDNYVANGLIGMRMRDRIVGTLRQYIDHITSQ